MKCTRMRIFLLLAHTAAIVFSAQAAKCAFEPTNEAPETLTCTFEQDLRQSKDHFVVNRYCFDNGITPVIVLSCDWREDPGTPCEVNPGYTFNASAVVSNQIFLGFQYLTKNIEGNYACQLVGDTNGVDDKERCSYKHLDAPKKTHCAFEPNDQAPEKLICTFAVDLRRTKHDFNVQRHGLEENNHPTIVLSCIWDKDVPEPRCYVATGYTFDNRNISSEIVLGIQKLAKAEGRYMCQLIPPACEDECIHTCKIKDVANTRCAFEPNNEAPDKLACTCDVDSGQMKHNVSVLVFRYGQASAIVFSGNWKDDQLKYPDVAEGYTFDNKTNYSKIVLRIENLTRNPKDVYRCQVVLPLGEDDINETCPYKQNGNNHAENDERIGIIVGVSVGVIVCIGIIVLVIYLKKRYGDRTEGDNGPAGEPLRNTNKEQ